MIVDKVLSELSDLTNWYQGVDGQIRDAEGFCPLAVLCSEKKPYLEIDNNDVQLFMEILNLSEDDASAIVRAADNALASPSDQSLRWEMERLLKPEPDPEVLEEES